MGTGIGDHAFVYSNGAMTDLGAGDASAINASGEVVGNDFIYSNGTKTDRPHFPAARGVRDSASTPVGRWWGFPT